MLASHKLIPNEERLGRIPRSCKAGDKCRMAFECLHRGNLFEVGTTGVRIVLQRTPENSKNRRS